MAVTSFFIRGMRPAAAHDDAWEKVMADPRVKNLELPFDGRRLIFGTFGSIAGS